MKKLLLLFIALAVHYSGKTQSLSPSVISSTGNFLSASGISLSSTTGEMAMIETYTQGSAILTQGFQQPKDIFVGIENPATDAFTLTMYPNPSAGIFKVLVHSPHSGKIKYRIIDNTGKLVWHLESSIDKGFFEREVSLNFLSDGLYQIEAIFTGMNGETQPRYFNTISIIH